VAPLDAAAGLGRALTYDKRVPRALAVRRAARAALQPRKVVRDRVLRRRFARTFLPDPRALTQYEREVQQSGLVDHLREKGREFHAAIAGADGWTIGAIAYRDGVHLYSVLRTLKPTVAVETGVCNGFSTAFALLALDRNGSGELYSIDLPRIVGRDAPGPAGAAGIPEGRQPGWLIPGHLSARWTLVLGRSQDELPPLLERLGTIDFFMHDSEHSFECMWFEFETAWPRLREGGVLMSDDVNSTPAFFRFASEQGREPIMIGPGTAFIVK
jgi:predicted O-methyltransferase YrrM